MTESSSSRSISPGAWIRFIAPYYFINTITLLSYIPIRMKWTSDTLVESKENILNMSLEQEIGLLVVVSILLNYRKKATADGVVALIFMYGKTGLLACLYYLDKAIFGWYLALCTILFIALGTPKYIGPDELIPLNKASIEQLIKRNGGKNVKEASSWVVYFYADWNENCLQHDALVAQLSLEFTSASLKFGKVDCNRFPDAAKEYNIELNSTSWQLPTFILIHKGEIVSRLPGFDSNGKVVKTILDRDGIILVFRLKELSEGKKVEFTKNTSKQKKY